MNQEAYKDLIREYNNLTNTEIAQKRREEILSELNALKVRGIGEIFAVGWQFIVTTVPNNQTLVHKYFNISRSKVKYHNNQPQLLFQTKPVYLTDKRKDLEETIKRSREEYEWYMKNIEQLPFVWIPKEEYSISKAPLRRDHLTVRIESEMVNNIVGDINLDFKELKPFLKADDFRKSYHEIVTKLINLAEEDDIYPDYLGKENFAIHKTPYGYKIAVLDPHVVWVGKECREDVKKRLDNAVKHFKNVLVEIESNYEF